MMKTVYETEDGLIFNDPIQCALYELKECKDVLQNFNAAMAKVHPAHRNWCGGDPRERTGSAYAGCACMGCCNHEVYEAGFTYFHFMAWKDNFKVAFDSDDIVPIHRYEDVKLIMIDPGSNRINVLQKIRRDTGFGVLETKKLMEANAVIFANIFGYKALEYAKEYAELGATVKVERINK